MCRQATARTATRHSNQTGGQAASLFALVALFAAVPAWAQVVRVTASNSYPVEGPGAGNDTVLLYVSGLQGTAGAVANVTTDADWISLLSVTPGTNSMNVQNGPNRLRFQFAANTGATQVGHISVQLLDGGAQTIVTVGQASWDPYPQGWSRSLSRLSVLRLSTLTPKATSI